MRAAAVFDALYLVRGIASVTKSRSIGDGQTSGATEQEVHGLAYLACQLGKWTEGEVAWPYDFFKTPDALPYSAGISEALRDLRATGHIVDRGMILSMSNDGLGALEALERQSTLTGRSVFLSAACDAALVLPIPLVLRALLSDPTIQRAAASQPLLDESAQYVLAPYYDALVTATGEGVSLLALTELWLQYLTVVANSGESAAA